jgi:uncharacterized protein
MIMQTAVPPNKKLWRSAAGYSCIVVGIAGCVLPILPGVPLLFLGLGLLSVHNPWAANLLEKLKKALSRFSGKTYIPQSRPKPESNLAGD